MLKSPMTPQTIATHKSMWPQIRNAWLAGISKEIEAATERDLRMESCIFEDILYLGGNHRSNPATGQAPQFGLSFI